MGVASYGLRISHAAALHLFFFNDTATTEIYTLSLHDALPIFERTLPNEIAMVGRIPSDGLCRVRSRSEEHTSELQSHDNLVCRLVLEKKERPLRIRGAGVGDPLLRVTHQRADAP